MKKISLLGIIAFALVLMPWTSASVGVGMSPTKIVIETYVGDVRNEEVSVFNPGDIPLDISLNAEGGIAPFTTFAVSSATVQPEPNHEQPIENGQRLMVTFKPTKQGVFTGTITAGGGPTQNSQFGGTVGVAAQVVMKVGPAKSLLDAVTTRQIIIAGSMVAVLILFIVLQKAGLSVSFKKKGRNRDFEDV